MAKTATIKRPKINTNAAVNRLAYRIASDLMTSGGGCKELAERLVLEFKDGRDGGGWDFKSIVSRIAAHLRGEL